MKTAKLVALSIAVVLAVGLCQPATAQTKFVSLWNGEVGLTVPAAAGSPKKLSANLYSIQPTAKKSKIVLYATRERILNDEKKLTDSQLAASIKTVLEAQGYTVESLKGKKGIFSAKLSGILNMPWRKVGASSARGMAQFKRTSSGQLVGALVLTDPEEWSKKSARGYRAAVTKVEVKD